MNNALARLIGQAEVRLAEAGRRTVESVAAPLREKGQEMVSDALGIVTSAVKSIAIKAALGLVAAIMVIVAIVYALEAVYAELLPSLGPVETPLVIAAAFLVIAIIAVVAMLLWPSSSSAAGTSAAKVKQDAKEAVTQTRAAMSDAASSARETVREEASVPPPNAPNLKSNVESLISVLGDAGFRREQAGLRAGLALASQLSPMQIVGLALIGGFVTGLRFPSRR